MDAVQRRVLLMVWVGASPLGCETNEPKPVAPAATSVASGSSAAPALGVSASAAAMASASATTTQDRPLYYEREITEADLRGRTLRELSLMRNTIYARVGNPFRRPWLNEYFEAQAWYRPLEAADLSKLSALDKTNARKIADFDGGLSRDELEELRDAVLGRRERGQARPEDDVEISLLSQRLGAWLGESKASKEVSPLEDPSQLDALLTVEELSTLSRRDLRILRNTIYARRGRLFGSKVVQGYFEGSAWYRPDPDYHDGRLTEIDRKNIAIVRSVETTLGGPLHENPEYGDPDWFIAA
jgi:hypothetical protein